MPIQLIISKINLKRKQIKYDCCFTIRYQFIISRIMIKKVVRMMITAIKNRGVQLQRLTLNITENQISNHRRWMQPTESISYTYSQASFQKQQVKEEPLSSKPSNELNNNIYIPFDKMEEAIKEDANCHHQKYEIIRQSLIDHIQRQHYNKNNQQELIEVLFMLSDYPAFSLPKETVLMIYRIVCFNMHLKTVESMNKLLMFVLVADQNVSQSPIFIEFIKFYLQVPLEELKITYQINLQQLSLLEGIKQFIGRLVQRGFLTRTPPYYRNLNILSHQKILLLLLLNSESASSLMVKKINYTIFMDIKSYYEQQMNENLYHQKKVVLMQKFNTHFMKVLSQQITMTHQQNIHLRELYMKLYLSLPSHNLHEYEQQETRPSGYLLQKVNVLKYHNAVFLYHFARQHISSLDHLTLSQVAQDISLAIEFVQQVQRNFNELAHLKNVGLEELIFETEQLLLILNLLLNREQTSDLSSQFQRLLLTHFTAFNFHHYFNLFFNFLKQYKNTQSIEHFLSNLSAFSMLSLHQLSLLSTLITQPTKKAFPVNYFTLLQNIFIKILSTDYQKMQGQQIIKLLKIYERYLYLQNNYSNLFAQRQKEFHKNAEILRVFIMRYIADHHRQFKVNQFEEIIITLLQMPENIATTFDDENNSYPQGIFYEIKQYLSTVQMLLSAQTKELLRTNSSRLKQL